MVLSLAILKMEIIRNVSVNQNKLFLQFKFQKKEEVKLSHKLKIDMFTMVDWAMDKGQFLSKKWWKNLSKEPINLNLLHQQERDLIIEELNSWQKVEDCVKNGMTKPHIDTLEDQDGKRM